MGLGPVSEFLARVLEPPQPRAVTAALEVLKQVGGAGGRGCKFQPKLKPTAGNVGVRVRLCVGACV